MVSAHGIVGGLHTRPVLIDASEPQEGLQYGLTPLGVHALLGVPSADLSGHNVDLVDLFGPRAVQLLDELQGASGWPERFRLSTGLTPKQAVRIARFEAARRLLVAPQRPPLGDVAVRCGYVDQPHLARKWRLSRHNR